MTTESPANSPEHWAGWEPPAGGDTLPALTVEIDGLVPVSASEDSGQYEEEPGGPDAERPTAPPSFQVFRRPGDYAGPTAYVMSGEGINIPGPGQPDVEAVEVAGHAAALGTYNPEVPALGWRLPGGAAVYIKSWQLTRDELLQFASGLQPREHATGFEATALPQDMVEHPLVTPVAPYNDSRSRGEHRSWRPGMGRRGHRRHPRDR